MLEYKDKDFYLSQQQYMLSALELAAMGEYTVSPNPMVGCVIVKNNQIIGKGFHQHFGGEHAEVIALKDAGSDAVGADMYVTLEPCSHYGKKPPCVNPIIASGIKRVFIACIDLNPLVCGMGVNILKSKGIDVIIGLCENEAKQLNEIFFHYIQYQKPFIIAKWAMSIDGKTVTHPEDNRQISGVESHTHLHYLRQKVDAILIGAGTAKYDDPLLTSRLSDNMCNQIRQPTRIIVASKTQLPLNLKVFKNPVYPRTILATTEEMNKDFIKALVDMGVEVMILRKDDRNLVDLKSLINELGVKNITSILIEGGRTIHDSFFTQGLINKVCCYVSPVMISNLKEKIKINDLKLKKLGCDYYFSGNINV
jgi:diaminohydroxyphosphoribosylaminopyrimidine deaminase / 5-amino-6-(5-phosphoribosylamino)uracil reductase